MTTATAQPGPLKSDHINYLILRYLQEAGHEASATAFYRDWRRPAEFRDPEDLPFAPAVQRHELVSVIQDGLYHDELLSRVRKGERRFNFTTNGVASGSRPGTAGKGKGRIDQMRRGTEDFPTPPPKRQRKSEEGPGERQINGLAEPMEVDAASPSAGDAEDDAEGASPAVQSPEPEIVEIPERYDSMDVAVQTDGKTGPKTSTMYWRVGKSDATILHITFSPAKGSRVLFTAGEGIAQFYDLPGDFESQTSKVLKLEDESAGSGSAVTACAWHPEGYALAFAVDMARDVGVGGKQEKRQVVQVHDARTARSIQYHSPPLLEPQGIVFALRYSWDGSHLLAVRTNGSRATVEVWKTQSGAVNGAMENVDVAAWRVFEDRILDAAWISQFEFVVCGDDGLLEKFRLTSSEPNGLGTADQALTPQNARMRGLEALPAPGSQDDTQKLNFDKIRTPSFTGNPSAIDANASFVVAASEQNFVVQGFPGSNWTRVMHFLAPRRDDRITALAFRPSVAKTAAPRSTTLAVTQESGCLHVRSLQGDVEGDDVDLDGEVRCQLADGSPALALAWSPEASYLAVSGLDVVQIWEAKALEWSETRARTTPRPIVTWRRDKGAAVKGLRNGEHNPNGAANGDDEPLQEPSLSWSTSGDSLALAVGSEIAVIRFRPPLLGDREEGAALVNGHGS